MVRVTIGAMSTLGDVEILVECIKQQLVERGQGTQNTSRADEGPVKDGISLDTKPKADVSDSQKKVYVRLKGPFSPSEILYS
jgi:hypothetical protein